jgi:two-component system CheB/CheR fusion protein
MLFKLIPGDVGRPITDITSELHYPELADHALEVLRTLAFHEQQVPTRGVQWYQVRIMPYRTLENRINGVVITFTDVTASKMLEAQLRTTQAGLEDHIAVEAALKSKAEARQAKPAAKESKTPARPGEGQP